MALFYFEDFFSWSRKDQIPSFIPSLLTDVDDGVGIGDDVEIMFDDEDAIPLFYQFIEDIEELLDIREVETCCRLIEDIECLPCRPFGEIKCELDTLRLSS